ncbi:hypothetical protein SAMN02745163_01141 [Clostridium cavendishii DSM 21758]|uniref:S1 motif domain-containing protein n=1 Tax=Clostridium cavendishii DSM 21758 TaxID=1121302 RepID=A0A1M6FHX3_9CLOT|nr:S1-like domain-containing RNA-binding protein [Clostridium cavendishii]SHI97246.1 hypothetical protein SAMN02745163_01141 [Clostridium cavendishii DSM 21758]
MKVNLRNVKLGDFNLLKIVRKADFGYYLDAKTGNTNDDILLPNGSIEGKNLSIGDEVNAFIYRDSKDRVIATLKAPLAKVGEVAYLKVTSNTKIGSFADFGLEKDILIPLREQKYRLDEGQKYLLYIYEDKTGRLAATTDIDKYLEELEINQGEKISGIVYGFQTNGSLRVAIDGKYKGVVLKNEYFTNFKIGDKVEGVVKRIYDDGIVGIRLRATKLEERSELQKKIVKYLEENDGVMKFNDKSSPESIKEQFNTSKNYFKIALGGLMKQDVISQDEFGTKLK